MARRPEKNLIVGLDIGTSKIAILIGEVDETGMIHVIGIGQHPSRGLKRGVIVNLESTIFAIQRAIEEAELMAGCEIHSLCAGISANHIRGFNSHGVVAIRANEVSAQDVDRVIDAAKAVAIPADQKILHILPQEFMIDNEGGIREPIGMSGVRLETRVHMVTGSATAAQNVIKCVQRCNVSVDDVILEPLAAGLAVLTDEEKELGVCLVDIGGGTTDIAVFMGGAIRHTAVLPIGGDQVTNDIAIALRTPPTCAEDIKIQYGCALARLVDTQIMIDVPTLGDRPAKQISCREVADVAEPRYEELLGLVLAELRRSGYEDLIASGIVLTGGSTKIEGIVELGEEVFNMPVRVAVPQNSHIMAPPEIMEDPAFSTCIGLLLYTCMQQGSAWTSPTQSPIQVMWDKVRNWFQGSF